MLSTKRHESSRLGGDELIQSELNPFCVRVRQEARMETLNLSDSTPRSESRLKSLFWPSIQNGADVDYLGTPGYWFAHSWQLFPSFSPWQLASPLWERSCCCFITSAEWV
jgi:hypothetical protein